MKRDSSFKVGSAKKYLSSFVWSSERGSGADSRTERERIRLFREKEERERLLRKRNWLEVEKERLNFDRLEREFLERERQRVEYERRREQERIQRERDELRRQQEQLRFEQDRRPLKRPYADLDNRYTLHPRLPLFHPSPQRQYPCLSYQVSYHRIDGWIWPHNNLSLTLDPQCA